MKAATACYEEKAEYALLRTKQKLYTGGRSSAGPQTLYAGHGATGGRIKVTRWYTDMSGELIRQQFERFYSHLYSMEGIDYKSVEDYLDFAPVAQLPPVDSATLENDITPTEVLASIHQLQPGKAPGVDGFGAEFYESFGIQ
ncbi:hypothetical protein NDU88_007166 [Pleurodeles waltl]|uniref:Uncharacterized protein n=1 Tax=Pleurodeles waltl TaxID=8319 RepID=A0AAV7N1B4_PLEWA|nr:hypothetical protein NDU88_007166 [Pleurodeles waltl]